MRGKFVKLPVLLLVIFASTEAAFATNTLQHDQGTPHKPVATILPEGGKLTGEGGVLHQGLALECAGGKPGGISYFSPENDLGVAVGAQVNIDINIDHNDPVMFIATRRFNAEAPDALTSKSDDTDSAIRLIHNLEITQNDVEVEVNNPVNGKTKTFKLKGSDMKGTVKSFKTYCNVN